MIVTILDGYVDEPAALGVPPYLSHYVRYIAGAAADAGAEVRYLTVDAWRKEKKTPAGDLLVIIAGALVPGKYLRGTPISYNETQVVASSFPGTVILAGGSAVYGFGEGGGREARSLLGLSSFISHFCSCDADAAVYDYLTKGSFSDRLRTTAEWNRWALKGAFIAREHPDHPNPLICEIETYRGCVRYLNGGCSFCMEPHFGRPVTRETEDIISEVRELSGQGVVNFRLGAQSCFFSYMASGVGMTETPRPNPAAVKELLCGIRTAAPGLKVLHIDNATPAIIAEHPKESRKVAEHIVEYCTPGNVAAFGLESADPDVKEANNLNATAEQAMSAIKLLNEVGNIRGGNGMPHLLPGINLLHGLKGETKRTYKLNFDFLRQIYDGGLTLRRINVRQVLITGGNEKEGWTGKKYHGEFLKLKRRINDEINRPMLKRLVPEGTVLRDVYLEKFDGGASFGRQVGSYPLLVGIPYEAGLERFVDVKITDYGFRSVTGVEYPFPINGATVRALEVLPGIGKRRAQAIAAARPFASFGELEKLIDDKNVSGRLGEFISIGNSD
ncbi:MAG: radical SAM protein [Thermoplasmata archaeon HGW-Thermoplasmata-1]|nr:MAG: radical SAM protein [Thermoplasmata archaeon HGW-Thermoplasmata-1]